MKKKKERKQAAKGTPVTQASTMHPGPSTETWEEDTELNDERSGVDESCPQREEASTLAEDLMTAAGVMPSDNDNDDINSAQRLSKPFLGFKGEAGSLHCFECIFQERWVTFPWWWTTYTAVVHTHLRDPFSDQNVKMLVTSCVRTGKGAFATPKGSLLNTNLPLCHKNSFILFSYRILVVCTSYVAPLYGSSPKPVLHKIHRIWWNC